MRIRRLHPFGCRRETGNCELAGYSGLPAPQEQTRARIGGACPAETARILVFCLGPFRVVVDGVAVAPWRSGRVRSLFQYMANHHSRPVPRDKLIEAFWPNPDASTPGTSLKVAVHNLRQFLGQSGIGSDALAIQAHEAGYLLRAPSLWLDVEDFEACFDSGRRLEVQGRAAEAETMYCRAAGLYRGDFLEESWDDWAVFRRESLRDRFLFVLARLAEMALTAGDYQGCILRCQQLLEQDRCREDSYRILMLCHSRLGQRSRVRSWYDLCVKSLRAELDVAPEMDTQRLYLLALRGEA